MKISKIKILDNGFGGVELEGIEPVKAVQGYFIDSVTRTRKGVLSKEIMDAIKKLTYFYLSITGHWLAPFDKYIDKDTYSLTTGEEGVNNSYMLIKDIWDKTNINKITIQGASFSFSGTIETVERKPISISTPKITMEDDFGFFDDAISKIQELWELIAEFVESKAIASPERTREYIETHGSDKDKEEAVKMSDEEIMKKAAVLFDQKGIIFLSDPDNKEHSEVMEAIGDGAEQQKVVESGDIDSSRQSEAEEVKNESFEQEDNPPTEEEPPTQNEEFPTAEDEATPIDKEEEVVEVEEEIEIIPENKGVDFGPPASEGDFKDIKESEGAGSASFPNDLSEAEFSENPSLEKEEYD
jgi:hypothetical protein